MRILIEGKIFNLDDFDVIDLQHDVGGVKVVRLQARNRRDEIVVKDGKTYHLKNGVYELPPDLSEKFRFFIQTFSGILGIIDLEDIYSRRDEILQRIETAKAELRDHRQQETLAALDAFKQESANAVGLDKKLKDSKTWKGKF